MKKLSSFVLAGCLLLGGCVGAVDGAGHGDGSVSTSPGNGPAPTSDGSVTESSADGSATSSPTDGAAASGTPATPAGLSASAGDAKVFLTWAASMAATSYHLKRATTSGGPYTQIAAPTATSYTDAAVTNGTTYYYVVTALDSSGESASSNEAKATPDPIVTSKSCGMQLGDTPITFCETYDAPAGTQTRSGDLDGNVWGVSRTIGDEGANFGQHEYDEWNKTAIQKCDGTTPQVNAPGDIIICNGQLREATNDNNDGGNDDGTVTSLAMYPKQPFDFAGRTGTVSFDVSNDAGPHGAWPEFWLSDLPVPAPFNHFDSWQSLPANGFGIRFDSVAPIGMQGQCGNSNNLDNLRFTVESVAVSRGYVLEDTLGFGPANVKLTMLDCAIESSGPGQMNHIELRISQNQIDVYATDAGVAATPATLKHIAVVENAGLTLTRGLIWLEDVHYNGDKILDTTRPSQKEHTFSWDNVAFDGPFTYRDFAYDAPDNTVAGNNGSVNLGKEAPANGTSSWNIPGLPTNIKAGAARVLFNFQSSGSNATALNVAVNGHTHSVPWPYPDERLNTWRTYAVTVPLTDLISGTNVIELGADVEEVFANVDLVLGEVPNGVPVLPGAKRTYPN